MSQQGADQDEKCVKRIERSVRIERGRETGRNDDNCQRKEVGSRDEYQVVQSIDAPLTLGTSGELSSRLEADLSFRYSDWYESAYLRCDANLVADFSNTVYVLVGSRGLLRDGSHFGCSKQDAFLS